MSDSSKKKQSGKKPYVKPQLREYGKIEELTRLITGSGAGDGGTAPANRSMMNCVSAPSYVEEHRWLLQDVNVQNKFRDAIFAQVKPGDVVLDLGTGTGLHAFFAAQAGAAKVYAVDSEPILEMAKTIAKQNNLEDKITFIKAHSENLNLPEKVDVLITNVGFFSTLKFLPSAISKFLKPNGKVLPSELKLGISLLEDDAYFENNVRFWQTKPWGLEMGNVGPMSVSRPQYGIWKQEQFVAEMIELEKINLRTNKPVSFSVEKTFTANRDGSIHAVVGWYTYDLGAGFSFTTRPPHVLSKDIWNQWTLPLVKPLNVRAGEKVSVDLKFNLIAGYEDAIWRWDVKTQRESSSQSSFDSLVLPRQ